MYRVQANVDFPQMQQILVRANDAPHLFYPRLVRIAKSDGLPDFGATYLLLRYYA